MRAANLCSLVALLAIFSTGCSHKASSPPQLAQAPPLQTGKGTLSPPATTQPQEKTDTPLASPLPPPSAQSVPLPPPPPPKKIRHNKAKTPPAKPADTAQTNGGASGGASPQAAASGTQSSVQAPGTQQAAAGVGTGSPIGQLTTGDSASGEKSKHETADLISETQQGLNGIKRSLSTEEKATVAQIRNYLKQAQQALDTGDTFGANLLATKAKTLLDELTKP
jgi:hypothetical protein